MFSSLYVHIPFCIRKCRYCDFYSVKADDALMSAYCEALKKEIVSRKAGAQTLKTVYIGGGTPSLLPEGAIKRLSDHISGFFDFAPDAEITIEANPGAIDDKILQNLLNSGVNRISLGIQSLVDAELSALGRVHNSEDAVSAVISARRAGFRNISLDLIYGIPGQSLDAWRRTLLKAIDLSPEHISAYELTPEKNTPLYEDIQDGTVGMPDESLAADMFMLADEVLEARGFRHYEISNYARPGRECRHNLNYWDRGEYLGIGAAAHSFIDGVRYDNMPDVEGYITALAKDGLPTGGSLKLGEEDIMKEIIFLGLRKVEGIDLNVLKAPSMAVAADELILNGLLERRGSNIGLTRRGMLLSNEVILKLFEAL
ncbi:MAG: radical SAM family heme chaperone HemW [Nitrospirae bacterium]|nr:MAG: radical SAM family heme chaperone HemW [Nitrospirota bacterium]